MAPIQELGVRNCVMGKSGADSRVRVRNCVMCAARKVGPERHSEHWPLNRDLRICLAEKKMALRRARFLRSLVNIEVVCGEQEEASIQGWR